jgi:phage FluMu protein Com
MTEWRCHMCGRLLARRLTPPGEGGLAVEIRCHGCGHVNYFGKRDVLPVDKPGGRRYSLVRK